jgi:hypothetical protein
MKTDTPQNACPHCGAEVVTKLDEPRVERYACGTWSDSPDSNRRELCREREARQNAEADLIRTQIEMQLEIDKAEAEVERLKKELADWAYGTRAKREQERAEKAEAEVERLKEQLESTKLLAVKFWNVLEENGFKIELPK